MHATEKLVFDEQHSYVLWKIEHLGFSIQSGKWYVKGFIQLDQQHPDQSKVEVQVDLAKIVTGIPELDEHLKGPQFFDVAKYPLARFISDKIVLINKKMARVSGILNLHGVSKPLELTVHLNKVGKNPITGKEAIGFSATTKLKRSDF